MEYTSSRTQICVRLGTSKLDKKRYNFPKKTLNKCYNKKNNGEKEMKLNISKEERAKLERPDFRNVMGYHTAEEKQKLAWAVLILITSPIWLTILIMLLF